MKYLLDVHALVALGFTHHEFHDRVAAWIKAVRFPALATCSITDLEFVRVLAQAPSYGFTVTQARTFLLRLKKTDALAFTFISDDHIRRPEAIRASELALLMVDGWFARFRGPGWVSTTIGISQIVVKVDFHFLKKVSFREISISIF